MNPTPLSTDTKITVPTERELKTAESVASSFLQRYYSVWTLNPSMMAKFYKDNSKISLAGDHITGQHVR